MDLYVSPMKLTNLHNRQLVANFYIFSQSFENHLRGRAHQLMMEKLDESYKLKVDLMRHELRVSEEQRELSLNNSKRRGKKVGIMFPRVKYTYRFDSKYYSSIFVISCRFL